VEEALGSGSEIADIRVGWSGVTVSGLRIKGPQGWAATDALGHLGLPRPFRTRGATDRGV